MPQQDSPRPQSIAAPTIDRRARLLCGQTVRCYRRMNVLAAICPAFRGKRQQPFQFGFVALPSGD